jgi:hypothetical protein
MSLGLAKPEKLFPGHDIVEGPELLGELLEAFATVEVVNRDHDRVAFGLGAGVADDFIQGALRNIDGGLHAPIKAESDSRGTRKGFSVPGRDSGDTRVAARFFRERYS